MVAMIFKNKILKALCFSVLLNSCQRDAEEAIDADEEIDADGDLVSDWVAKLRLQKKENGVIYERESLQILKELEARTQVKADGGGSDMGVSFRDYQIDLGEGEVVNLSFIGRISLSGNVSVFEVSSIYVSREGKEPKKFSF